MIPWEKLDRAATPDGGELTLHRRGHEFTIRVNGADLMGSRQHGSEEALAVEGCAGLGALPRVRVLVGGLGMGFTARAALNVLGPDARVDVAEISPAVVAWNRGPLSHLADHPLADNRVRVLEGDVAKIIAGTKGGYNAILLDVDNGPSAMTTAGNDSLYDWNGLSRALTALTPGGVYAVWSAADDPKFTARLRDMGFETRVEHVRARRGRGGHHTLWLARTPKRPT